MLDLIRKNLPSKKALVESYWGDKKFKTLHEAITLEKANSHNPEEFHVYGIRLVSRMTDLIKKHAQSELGFMKLLEIGCGIGRMTLPFACHFKEVHALDVSSDAVETAKKYCASVPNVRYYTNDGTSLEFANESFDCLISTGVFQHITDFDVITNYLKEGLRVLRPGGLFLFTFQGWQTEAVGRKRVGAKVTAKGLDEALKDHTFNLLALSCDPKDPLVHIVALIQKPLPGQSVSQSSFSGFPIDTLPYRTGVFEDLKSCSEQVNSWKQPVRPMTFND